MLIDITRTIGHDDVAFPGDPQSHVAHSSVPLSAGGYTLSSLIISAHAGTHLDTPRHFFPDAPTVDKLPIERFCLDAVVVAAKGLREIGPQHVDWDQVRPGMALLLQTDNELLPRDQFQDQHVILSLKLAERLIEHGVGMLGIDYINIESDYDTSYPLHRLLLGADVLILEDADLCGVAPGEYRLYCFPMRIAGVEAAPCRAVLETKP